MSNQHENEKQPLAQNHDIKFDGPVRSIYVAPVTPLMRGQIRAYFERFGKVESVRVRSKDDFYYCFVQFRCADSAKKALSKTFHRINGRIVKVKQAFNWHQPDYRFKGKDNASNDNAASSSKNPVLIVPDQESASHILKALDDDCLKEIFKYLHLQELCNAAEVCVRFQQNAQEHFKLHHTKMGISELCLRDDSNNKAVISLPIVERFFRNFAKFIKTLILVENVFDDEDCDTLLIMVNEYCAGTLNELFMYGFEINSSVSFALRPMFAKLIKLVMYNFVRTKNLRHLLAVCHELKVFRIGNGLFGDGKWLQQKFVNLTELEIDFVYGLSLPVLNRFFILNPNLEGLVIAQMDLPSKVFLAISKRLPKLQRFHFNHTFDETEAQIKKNLLHLTNMKSLKSLQLNFDSFAVMPLINSLSEQKTTIEKFGMLNGTVDKEIIMNLSKLSNVTSLHLTGTKMDHMKLIDLAKYLPQMAELRIQNMDGIDANEIVKMLPHANNLNTLDIITFKSDVVISSDSYNAILNVVKNRTNAIKLTINIFCNRSQVLVPRHLMQMNRYWLDIKEVCLNLDPESDSDSQNRSVTIIHGIWFGFDYEDDDEDESDIEMDIDDDTSDEQSDNGEMEDEEGEEQHPEGYDALIAMLHFIRMHFRHQA